MLRRFGFQMVGVLCAIPLWAMAGVPVGPADLLRAEFDNKTLGAPIGTGGASVGEPTEIVALDTIIVDCASAQSPDSGSDQCLEVSNDLTSTTARPIRWQFLNNAEITSGVVSMRFDFIPSALDRYNFGVREAGASANSFLTITTSTAGTITATDANGTISVNPIFYSADQLMSFQLDFDMDAGTSQAFINGNALFVGRAHGITTRGVGRLNTGYASSNSGNPFRLNNLVVQTPQALPIVLDADFNDQPLAQSLGTGGAAANQPVLIAAGITTQIISVGPGDNALEMSLPSAGGASRTIRWEFLDNIEVVPGVVAFETDVQFGNLNAYQFLVREVSSSTASYTLLTFAPSGQMAISDQGGSGFIPGASYQAGIRYRLRFTFDQAQGTYSAMLDNVVLFSDRAHGVSNGRGIGALLMGFSNSTTAGASMIIDDVQVGASAAADIVGDLEILQQPTTGTVGQALAPTLQVGALNVFDQPVGDGAVVAIDYSSGPAGAILTNDLAGTLAGVASFPSLAASAAGVYQLRARADRAQVPSATPLTVAPSDILFRDGFEAQGN
jgi:hypothetical protein